MSYIDEKLNELKGVLSPEEFQWFEKTIIGSDSYRESLQLEKLVSELNIQIGDYVEIILPENPVSEERMNQMVGRKGVITDFNRTSFSYYYAIWLEDEDAREVHKDGGGIFFHPTYVHKLQDNPSIYSTYLEEKKRIEHELKYRWGTCDKCQGPMDMYYVKWCPYCDKPETKPHPNGQQAIVLLKAMKYAETHLGIDNLYDDFWDYILEKYPDFSNDTFISLDLIDKEAPDFIQKTLSFIRKEWDLGEETMVWISW